MKNKVKELSGLLREKMLVLASAESCTGGMIAAAITDLAGSSDVFDRGFVTYSNKAKQELLGVSKISLEKYGAVSKEVASEMVLGALENSDVDIAVAVTGIAGPGGGTEEKPIGLVYVATCVRGKNPNVVRCDFEGNREQVRSLTCKKAFDLLIQNVSAI